MSRFPDPILPDNKVLEERRKRKRHLLFAVRWGVTLRLLIVAAELAAFLIFGSFALLMDAIASSLDIISSIFLIFALFLATRPPDKEHPFGHGRYEPLAGMLLGVLLTVIGFGMLLQQLWLVVETVPREPLAPLLWVVPFGAVVLLEICYRIVCYAAKKEDSPALIADAVHYRIDALTSLFAAVALVLGAAFPEWSIFFDQAGACLIAVLMIALGAMAARKNVQQLMDRAPDDEYFKSVRRAALAVPGVYETEKVRIQLYGPDAHVDIDVEVAPNLSVEEAHRISQHVRVAIQKVWPKVRDVTVHIEPYYPGDH